jgi:hypothetical protein
MIINIKIYIFFYDLRNMHKKWRNLKKKICLLVKSDKVEPLKLKKNHMTAVKSIGSQIDQYAQFIFITG